MKLSELVANATSALEKYGDREVFIDVEARTFDCHYVNAKFADMSMGDDTYKENPDYLDEPVLGAFIISTQ